MKSVHSSLQLLLGLLLTGAANAQPAPDILEITFSVPSVPLSPWLAGILAASIGIATLAFFRRQGGQRAFLLAVALVVASAVLMLPRETGANPVTPTPLVTSPYHEDVLVCAVNPQGTGVVVQGGGGPRVFGSGVQNGITLNSVTITGPNHFVISPSSTCKQGTHLQGMDTCTVIVACTDV